MLHVFAMDSQVASRWGPILTRYEEHFMPRRVCLWDLISREHRKAV
jgi:hypothetical protein